MSSCLLDELYRLEDVETKSDSPGVALIQRELVTRQTIARRHTRRGLHCDKLHGRSVQHPHSQGRRRQHTVWLAC